MYSVTCNDTRTPSRGWYSIFSFTLSKAEDYDELKWSIRKDEDLALVRINLCEFRDGEITGEGLENLSGLLNFFKNYDREVILRFVYDVDGKGLMNEPSSKKIIMRHMEQLAPYIIKNKDNIITVQGVFTGSWGEMHTSRYANSKDIADLVVRLYEVSKGSVNIALRTPAQIRELESSLRWMGFADSEKLIEKIGLFDDGILASPTDMGTFSQDGMSDDMAMIKKIASHNFVGGECVNNSELNDGKAAADGMRERCVTYLNSQYDTAIIEKWKTQKLDSSGMTVYQYISEHLGYRLELASIKSPIFSKNVEIHIKNTGFAPFYGRLRMTVDEKFTAEADADVIQSGAVAVFRYEKSQIQKNLTLSCVRVFDGKSVAVSVVK